MQIIEIDQGSYEWHCLRQGKVTGTTLKSALGTPKVQATLMYKLIADRMTEPQITDINSAAVERGNEMEPIARRASTEATGLEFAETGMLLADDVESFGLSPDAIYMDGGAVVGGLEIKCPDSKKHVEYLINNAVPKEYIDQVKAPFILDDSVQWWYFASFDDRNYERPLFLKKVERKDFPTIDEDREKLRKFVAMVHHTHMGLTF